MLWEWGNYTHFKDRKTEAQIGNITGPKFSGQEVTESSLLIQSPRILPRTQWWSADSTQQVGPFMSLQADAIYWGPQNTRVSDKSHHMSSVLLLKINSLGAKKYLRWQCAICYCHLFIIQLLRGAGEYKHQQNHFPVSTWIQWGLSHWLGLRLDLLPHHPSIPAYWPPLHQSSSSGHRWAARGGTHHLSGVCVHVFIIRAILVGAAQRVEGRKRLACPSVCRPAWWGAQHPLPGISCFLSTSLVSFQDQSCR